LGDEEVKPQRLKEKKMEANSVINDNKDNKQA
jgi:hypothetical protein